MTTVDTLDPLERLNYFNGQRLEAKDLRVEQEYHIRVRRQLNQALYTPGVATGLEVSPSANAHAVIVSPGVALDVFGRDVIMLEPTEVAVCGLPNTNPAWVYGNFLYIRYEEEEIAVTNDGCTSGKNQLAWGGPTRIRAVPVLAFADAWPNESEGPIILTQVELDASCAVVHVHNQVRKYVDAARPATRTVSYEGEKDIAKESPKRLSFHVIGGPATSATLYLWADKFSALYYTQLGAHEHRIPPIDTDKEQGSDLSHTHGVDLSQVTVGSAGSVHGSAHDIVFPANKVSGNISNKHAIDVSENLDSTKKLSDLGNEEFVPSISGGSHTHDELIVPAGGVVTFPPQDDLSLPEHGHTTLESTTDATGQGAVIPAGTTARLTYIDDLKVSLDGTDITAQIRSQLGGSTNDWDKLGDGTSAHHLNVAQGGTGAVALERIATLNQGEHTLEFLVDNDSGGNLRYNLYVE